MPHNIYDILSKGIIEDFTIDFLRFFYPNADDIFDFSKPIELLDTELSNIDTNRALMKDSLHADKIIKVYARSEREGYIFLLVEIQRSKELYFAKRVHTYLQRLLDKYGERVSVLVIYTNSSKRYQPNEYSYSSLDTQVKTRFAFYSVIGQKEEDLLKQDNIFAIFLLIILWSLKITKKKEEVIFEKIKALVKDVLQREMPEKKLHKILDFLKLYPTFGDQLQCVVDEFIDSIIIKNTTMGITEAAKMIAVERAKEKERNDFVTGLLQESDFPIDKIAKIAKVPMSFVRSVKKKMMLANV